MNIGDYHHVGGECLTPLHRGANGEFLLSLLVPSLLVPFEGLCQPLWQEVLQVYIFSLLDHIDQVSWDWGQARGW